MKKITTSAELFAAVEVLKIKQADEMLMLKTEFLNTYESLKPINIIKGTLKKVISIPDIKGSIVNAAIGLASGYIAKKVVVGGSNNPCLKIIGSVLEMIVANKVANNAEDIKVAGSIVYRKVTEKSHQAEGEEFR